MLVYCIFIALILLYSGSIYSLTISIFILNIKQNVFECIFQVQSPLLKAGSPRADCSTLHPFEFRLLSKVETPQAL